MYEENEGCKQTNKQTNKPRSLLELKAEEAVCLLEERIADIPDVQTWAKKAGVSRRWLCKSMKAVYGKSPKIILREMKYEKVAWLICDEGLETGSYSVAVDAGFKSASGLSKFLSAYHNLNFTGLKAEIMTDEEHLTFNWLDKMPR